MVHYYVSDDIFRKYLML